MGHLGLTIGYLKATVVHIRVTIGHLRVTIGYKANATELHPKVRQTCYFCNENNYLYLFFVSIHFQVLIETV